MLIGLLAVIVVTLFYSAYMGQTTPKHLAWHHAHTYDVIALIVCALGCCVRVVFFLPIFFIIVVVVIDFFFFVIIIRSQLILRVLRLGL